MASDLPEGCAIYGRHLQRPENSASLDDLSEGSAKIIFILQMTICLTGILGNSLSLVVILRDRKLKTVPNVYITHLAVVDLISCMLIPVSIGQHFTHGIPEVACKIIGKLVLNADKWWLRLSIYLTMVWPARLFLDLSYLFT